MATATVDILPTGGTVPYSFYWENASNDTVAKTEDVLGLKAGVYKLSVADANACLYDTSIFIYEPSDTLSFVFDSLENASCNTCDDGYLRVVVYGGTLPYSVLWNHGYPGYVIRYLRPETYCVTVVDGNGCFSEACDTIRSSTNIGNAANTSSATIYPNPVTDGILRCFINNTEQQAILKIYDLSGKEILNQPIVAGVENTIDVSNWSKGICIFKMYRRNDMEVGKIIIR
jgi:hypothetical protein